MRSVACCVQFVVLVWISNDASAVVLERRGLAEIVQQSAFIVLVRIEGAVKVTAEKPGMACGYVYNGVIEEQLVGPSRKQIEFVGDAGLAAGRRYVIFVPNTEEVARRRHRELRSRLECAQAPNQLPIDSMDILEHDVEVSSQSGQDWYRSSLNTFQFPANVPNGTAILRLPDAVPLKNGGLATGYYDVVQWAGLKAAVAKEAARR